DPDRAGQELEGDLLVERAVAGDPDLAHRSTADQRDELVLSAHDPAGAHRERTGGSLGELLGGRCHGDETKAWSRPDSGASAAKARGRRRRRTPRSGRERATLTDRLWLRRTSIRRPFRPPPSSRLRPPPRPRRPSRPCPGGAASLSPDARSSRTTS